MTDETKPRWEIKAQRFEQDITPMWVGPNSNRKVGESYVDTSISVSLVAAGYILVCCDIREGSPGRWDAHMYRPGEGGEIMDTHHASMGAAIRWAVKEMPMEVCIYANQQGQPFDISLYVEESDND